MDKHYFIELLQKNLEGKSTDEEDEFLLSYYQLFEAEPDVVALMAWHEKQELKNEMNESIWQNIHQHEKKLKGGLVIHTNMKKLAAAAIFIAVCLTTIFLLRPHPTKQVVISFQNQQKENRLVYLQDGSSVILTAGSKLNYSSSFDGLAQREVYLEGEAYFDITHNPAKRFIVHTQKLQVTVLGTAFNVKSNSNDPDITVSVTRGRVKISDADKTLGLITKGQQIIYKKSNDYSIQKVVNANADMPWKRRDLLLDDVTVEEAAKLLEERFDVQINFSNSELKSNRFTTVFLGNENLEQILRSICEFNNAMYEYNKEKSTVTIRKINPN